MSAPGSDSDNGRPTRLPYPGYGKLSTHGQASDNPYQKPPLVWEGQISQQRTLNVCAQVRAFRIWICSGFNLCPSTPTSLISRRARSAKLLRGRVSGANRLDGSLLSIFWMHTHHGRN